MLTALAVWLILATLLAILWQLIALRERTADSFWSRAFARVGGASATWDGES